MGLLHIITWRTMIVYIHNPLADLFKIKKEKDVLLIEMPGIKINILLTEKTPTVIRYLTAFVEA